MFHIPIALNFTYTEEYANWDLERAMSIATCPTTEFSVLTLVAVFASSGNHF